METDMYSGDIKDPCMADAGPTGKGAGGGGGRRHGWLAALIVLTVIQALAFVVVTIITFLEWQHLETLDAALRTDISRLHRELGPAGPDRQHVLRRAALHDFGGLQTDSEKQEKAQHSRALGVAKRQLGIFADIIKAQEAIFERHCHDKTKVCPAGPRGDKGSVGDAGSRGSSGSPGFPGHQGRSGARGQSGSPGVPGPAGSRGNTGPRGPDGPDGIQGPDGNQGSQGLPGQMGVTGPRGSAGQRGESGDGGPLGPQGYSGVQGPPGAPGVVGKQGPRGEAGVHGAKGPDAPSTPPGCDCMKLPKFASPGEGTVRAAVNGTYSLPCSASGNPRPTLTVTKLQPHTVGKRTLQHTDTTARLDRVDSGDFGRYQCTAMNMYGSATKYVDVVPAIHKQHRRHSHTGFGV